MSQAIVNTFAGRLKETFDLLAKFIETCPDDIWAEKFGGWPVWQEIYHAVRAVNLFVEVPGQTPPPLLVSPEVCGLKEVGAEAPPQARIREQCLAARELVGRYLENLEDEDLPKRNETPFRIINFDLTHGGTLLLLASHNLYHLGAGDSALRSHGRPGVF
ncbi:MAG: DinB family protein [Candidatus Adiutrix sp.]|jgi:hypothetical protein|nr:DinB family protein [Candidatus Adiutrix sp.]